MQGTNTDNETIGVYVHIPFCQRKCRYCDFYSVTDLQRIPDYLEALQKEMELFERSKGVSSGERGFLAGWENTNAEDHRLGPKLF